VWGLATGVARRPRCIWLAHSPSVTPHGLAGGVALNCVANPRILRDMDYESVWIPPCASDSGAPLGSALWHYHQTLDDPLHVDGTARIQTVDRSTIPRFYGVIEKFAELTGVPVVLNTSFNLQEPIVQSPENAISCYLRTQMDVLVVGDFYVTDRRYPSHKP